jgi:hypothetical protein
MKLDTVLPRKRFVDARTLATGTMLRAVREENLE